MASAFDNKDSKKTGILLIVVLVVLVLVLAFVFGGAEGLWGVIKFFFTAILIVGFFGFVFYIVYYLFFKKMRRDIPYENWKSYLRSALDNGSDMMEELILTGDKNHSAKRFMTIKGYLRVLGFDGQEYDMFIGKRSGMNFLEEYKIIMLKPNQHSDLVGDVYVYGISLIMKYGFYFLNTNMLDFKAIDMSVANDTYRTLMYETLGDMKGLMDRATGLDAEFRREQMSNKLLKIPVMSGQQNNNNQGNQ
jgi:hypothetical protein